MRTRRNNDASRTRDSARAAGWVKVPYAVGETTFTFHLTREQVDLGPAGVVDYFAFDGSDVRRGAGRPVARGGVARTPPWGGANGDAVLGCWWALLEAQARSRGRLPGLDDRRHLLLAAAHCQLGSRRSVQNVYRSAYLPRGADRQVELADDERCRLKAIADGGDERRVREELEALFLSDLPAADELHDHSRACDLWLSRGLEHWDRGAGEGIQYWLLWVEAKARELQKRGEAKYSADGSDAMAVRFTRLFAHECFSRFQVCCAAMWGSVLLPALRNRFGLSDAAVRFMNLMHGVHQPAEVDGFGEADTGMRRGVLCGQALSLHPVGRWILGRSEYLEAFGAWVTHRRFAAIDGTPRMPRCAAYRRVILALLCAAHEYDRARQQYEARRDKTRISLAGRAGFAPVLPGSAGDADGVRDDGAALRMARLFETLAAADGSRCRCGAAFRYAWHDAADGRGVEVSYRCDRGHESQRRFTREQVAAAVADTP